MSLTPDIDIRLYNASGQRMHLPMAWIESVSFELVERGGCGTGRVQILAPWEQLSLSATEYVDVRLWGDAQVLYRGWVRQPEQGLQTPERLTLNLYGLMETLNGYRIRRDVTLQYPFSVSTMFLQIAQEYLVTPGRIPGLQLDSTGVDALGVVVQQLKGDRSFSAAMDALCEVSPDTLIWGCDVDSAGRNRLFVHPRATAVGYRYAVGRDVTAFVYPRDTTQVVNRLFVTGAKADLAANGNPPNLLTNASFEQTAIPGPTTSNLLQNGGFETNSSGTSIPPWNNPAGATVGTAATSDPVHSGSQCLALPTGYIYQDTRVSPGAGLTYNVSAWFAEQAGSGYAATVHLVLELLDSTHTEIYNATGPGEVLTADNVYRVFQLNYIAPDDSRIVYARVYVFCDSWSGQVPLVDDVALWTSRLTSVGWIQGQSSNGEFSLLDWTNMDLGLTAYDGELAVKVTANIISLGGYAEITNDLANRLSVTGGNPYVLTANVRLAGGSSGKVQIGARLYRSDGSLEATLLSPIATIAVSGVWQQISFGCGSRTDTTALDLFVRFLDDSTWYVDGLGVWISTPGSLYYPGDTITALRDVTDYAGVTIGALTNQLSAAAAASLTTYGEREAGVSNADIVDQATLDAFCVGYFNANAVPAIQARLTLDQATAPLGLDGQVKLVGLPDEPPPLPASKVTYTIAATVTIEADLNSERPDLALLLRQVQREARQAITAG